MTRLFTTDVPEFSGRTRVGARTFDASRSFVERAVSFPENIEVEATHTYNNPPAEAGAGGRGGPPAPGGRGAAQPLRAGSHSVVMHYSMVLLPEKPMLPRLFDERVGYFSTAKIDYGQDEHRAPQRRYITRWRLEKKDPNAAISEPVKPIVYWIDPATPAKWVPYMKKGVESWQPAFEAAGFKNAIIAKEAPTAAAGSGLESRRRALLGDPLAAVDHRERVGPARPRSAHRRDSRDRHPVLPQRHEPRAQLVLRPGRRARSARARRCRCPTI